MAFHVLDSSAVLAYLLNEEGGANATPYLPNAMMSTVNYVECISRLAAKKQLSIHESVLKLQRLPIEKVDFTLKHAEITASLHSHSREYGLSYGDCACLALALEKQLPAVTADREWSKVKFNIEVICIR